MNVLVTGGTGHLGGELLVDRGGSVGQRARQRAAPAGDSKRDRGHRALCGRHFLLALPKHLGGEDQRGGPGAVSSLGGRVASPSNVSVRGHGDDLWAGPSRARGARRGVAEPRSAPSGPLHEEQASRGAPRAPASAAGAGADRAAFHPARRSPRPEPSLGGRALGGGRDQCAAPDPGQSSLPLDIVPVDFAAEALAALLVAARRHDVYHISAGARGATSAHALALVLSGGFPDLPPFSFDERLSPEGVRRWLRGSPSAVPAEHVGYVRHWERLCPSRSKRYAMFSALAPYLTFMQLGHYRSDT